MSCSNCKYLNTSKKKDGKTSGCYYFCMIKDEYISGHNETCEKYEKDYYRTKEITKKIDEDGKNYDDRVLNLSEAIMFFIIVIILWFLSMIFG